MDQIDNYIGYIGLISALIFFGILVFKYVRYWKKLKEGYLQSGMRWPFFSQEELNQGAKRNFFGTYRMIFSNMGTAAKIIFSTSTDNPAIQKPLREIRRCYIAFFIFPIGLAIILIVATLLLGGVQ